MLRALTADYRAAGFDLLERLSIVSPEAMARFAAERPDVEGVVLLATCNRFEAYLDVTDDGSSAEEALVRAAASAAGVTPDAVAAAITARSGSEVAGHLFAVSSGLESLVVGEAEIAGQVSRALEAARRSGSTTSDLERLFQRASRTSSSVQNRTRVGLAGRSIVRLALDLAESRLDDWADVSVLLIGTGTYAGATLAALRERGVTEVGVYSPSGRAERFARREGVTAVATADLPARLATADVVLACSIATTPILDAARLGRARRAAGTEGAQLIVDLGLPRNIDPDVVDVPGVALLDLETISLHAPLPELQATDEAREIIAEAVAEYRADQQATVVTPAVVAFRAHVLELVEAEIERLRGRDELTAATERAMRHLASVLVHTPSTRARALAAAGEADRFTDALGTVFGIEAPTRAAVTPGEDELAG
ncbi:glutamyl-tRNA reductase [Amnibacterium sp.]|uniref:glutamyl-tRNA reductase n=1 Tax=Amnibacterium sp. TaxID=1872496 RepID=UPI0026224F9E|nr:glutamyl-tRNA reductase [Amnibacterium sp.]MCU1473419.1 hemA [Amnibacterium sp.]